MIDSLRKCMNIGVMEAKKQKEDLLKVITNYLNKENATKLRSAIIEAGGKAIIKKNSR